MPLDAALQLAGCIIIIIRKIFFSSEKINIKEPRSNQTKSKMLDATAGTKRQRTEAAPAHIDGVQSGMRVANFERQVRRSGTDRERRDNVKAFMENIGEHFLESIVDQSTAGAKEAVALINTLLEVCVVVTRIERAGISDEDKAKLKLLEEHALEGLDLIDAEEDGVYSSSSDDAEDEDNAD